MKRWDQTYTTVGTVSSSALLGGLVDLDVLDDQGAGVETLRVGVGLGVLQELQKELGGLDGPSGAGDTPLLACTSRYCQSYVVTMMMMPWCQLVHRPGVGPSEHGVTFGSQALSTALAASICCHMPIPQLSSIAIDAEFVIV